MQELNLEDWQDPSVIKAALERKIARYEGLTEGLRAGGVDTRNLPLEIG